MHGVFKVPGIPTILTVSSYPYYLLPVLPFTSITVYLYLNPSISERPKPLPSPTSPHSPYMISTWVFRRMSPRMKEDSWVNRNTGIKILSSDPLHPTYVTVEYIQTNPNNNNNLFLMIAPSMKHSVEYFSFYFSFM